MSAVEVGTRLPSPKLGPAAPGAPGSPLGPAGPWALRRTPGRKCSARSVRRAMSTPVIPRLRMSTLRRLLFATCALPTVTAA